MPPSPQGLTLEQEGVRAAVQEAQAQLTALQAACQQVGGWLGGYMMGAALPTSSWSVGVGQVSQLKKTRAGQ